MIRTTIIPDNHNVSLLVPDDYIGEQVEVLIFKTEEARSIKSEEKPLQLKPSQLRGFLSEETAKAMQEYVTQSRNEWDI